MVFDEFLTNSFVFSEWCARLFQHADYKGWTQEIHEEHHVEISSDRNDELSAVKVKDGCTLKLYRHYGKKELVYIATKHNSFLKNDNDMISSLSCHCKGIMSTGLKNFSFSGSKLNIWPKNNELKRTHSVIWKDPGASCQKVPADGFQSHLLTHQRWNSITELTVI